MVRFRCHTGHAFTASTLLAGVTQSVEEQLWSAMRTLEEAFMLLQNISETFSKAGNSKAAAEFSRKAKESLNRSKTLKDLVQSQEVISEDISQADQMKDVA